MRYQVSLHVGIVASRFMTFGPALSLATKLALTRQGPSIVNSRSLALANQAVPREVAQDTLVESLASHQLEARQFVSLMTSRMPGVAHAAGPRLTPQVS